MNQYGRQARRHWQTWLPNRFAQIQDPDQFFSDLGNQVAEEIVERSSALEQTSTPAGEEEYLQKLGRLNRIRQQAEEQVLAEMVLLPQSEDSAPQSAEAR